MCGSTKSHWQDFPKNYRFQNGHFNLIKTHEHFWKSETGFWRNWVFELGKNGPFWGIILSYWAYWKSGITSLYLLKPFISSSTQRTLSLIGWQLSVKNTHPFLVQAKIRRRQWAENYRRVSNDDTMLILLLSGSSQVKYNFLVKCAVVFVISVVFVTKNLQLVVSAVTVAERSMLTTMLATMLMWVCDSSLPCCSGWFPGASHVGCLSSGPGGLCQATDRKWSQYAPFPHIVQAGGALQHGKNIIRVFGGMRPTAADILIALFYFIFLHCRGTAHPTRFTTLSGMSKRYEHR